MGRGGGVVVEAGGKGGGGLYFGGEGREVVGGKRGWEEKGAGDGGVIRLRMRIRGGSEVEECIRCKA